MPLLLGVVVLVLLLWAANSFSKVDPKAAAKLLRSLGGVAIMLFAAFLFFRGEFGPAVTVGVVGLGILGWFSILARDVWRSHAEEPGPSLTRSHRLCRNGA